jgi:Zn-dependent M28 family amino/carboxypeptidase
MSKGRVRLPDVRAWAHQSFRIVDPKLALHSVWLLLLLSATALGFWYVRYSVALPSESERRPRTEARLVSTRGADQVASGEPAPEPNRPASAISTPVVYPVLYEPGPIAAAGDIAALASAFSAELAMAQIETLTGSEYLGRYPASPGGIAAGDYIARQFAQLGLQPAGEDGTYFQPFPFEYVTLASEPRLALKGPDGSVRREYELHTDYSAIVRWYSGEGEATGQVVWANTCSDRELALVKTPGKVVLCRTPSIVDAERNALEHGAAGLLLLTDPEERPPDFGSTYFEPWIPEPMPVFRVYPSVADDLLQGASHLGNAWSVEDLSLGPEPFSLLTEVWMEVQTAGQESCPSTGCQARNVLGVIPGRDPQYANKVIILGAHYDHLGQGPDGTVWRGANDNASGVAVLLEIARTWKEEGYVPRHTVLFAAWDAEEEGLLGSIHYVRNPQYALEDTVAMIQLDMVGAGEDTLWVDGGGELGARLVDVAEDLGIETERTGFGRSDHVPFQRSGVPASLLIWRFHGDGQSVPQYHRPMDTPDTIDIEKLETVGRIVNTTLLGMTEGEPSIEELLSRRANAVAVNDLDEFLASSSLSQRSLDRLWFAEAQALSPEHVAFQMDDTEVLGSTATATVRMTLVPGHHSSGAVDEVVEMALPTRFVFEAGGWRWAGPDLVAQGPEAGFQVFLPAGKDGSLQGLTKVAASQYAGMADRLGLSPSPQAALKLFPSRESLQASVGPSVSPARDLWVGPGMVKLTYSSEITTSQTLEEALAQLILAEAGVTEMAAPWLWYGLPLLFEAERDLVAAHKRLLPALERALSNEDAPLDQGTSWAAVEYLREQAGDLGMGQFIVRLGQACEEGLCAGNAGVDAALIESTGQDSVSFDRAWKSHWSDRLGRAQSQLDALMAERSAALAAESETAFLQTVDADVPSLLAEQRAWYRLATGEASAGVTQSARVSGLLQDGTILATVSTAVSPEGKLVEAARETTGPVTVRLTPHADRLRWAGYPFETLHHGQVTVLYPKGASDLAQAVAEGAADIQSGLAEDLGLEQPESSTVKLYPGSNALWGSVSPWRPLASRAAAEAGPAPSASAGESLKFLLAELSSPDSARGQLAVPLIRYLLRSAGVRSEWLLTGISFYAAREHDGGASELEVAGALSKVQRAARTGELHIPEHNSNRELTDGERELVRVQSWDMVRYLVYRRGWEALAALVRANSQGMDLASAFPQAIGQDGAQFELEWAKSLARAHSEVEWLEIANRFDEDRAYEHVDYLASPALAGRWAGSAGAAAAAAYIADAFSVAGLQPAGDLARTGPESTSSSWTRTSAYYQTVPISQTELLAAPSLAVAPVDLLGSAGQAPGTFAYREDFVLPQTSVRLAGQAEGELVWIDDPTYEGMDLTGKIVVRRASAELDSEIAQALEHGAAGLLLVGNKESRKELLAKSPPSSWSVQPGQGTHGALSAAALPVLELTQAGYERLVELIERNGVSLSAASGASRLGLEAHLDIPLAEPEPAQTANVLGLLPGTDPELAQEVVILGAHFDHVGDDPGTMLCATDDGAAGSRAPETVCTQSAGRRYAGANDDASGIAVLLEIARLWHESGYRPRRSVLFAAWGAQELGELGSTHYVAHPVVALDDTVSMLQLDTVGGGRGYYLEALGGGDREALLQFNLKTAEEWVDGRLSIRNINGRSDHLPFQQAGLPALLLTWREASDENWPDEIADEVQPYRLGVTGRMAGLTAMMLAR